MELLKHIDNRKENIYVFKFKKSFYDKKIYNIYMTYYKKLYRLYDKSFHKMKSEDIDFTLRILNFIRNKKIKNNLCYYNIMLVKDKDLYSEYYLAYYDNITDKAKIIGDILFIIPGHLTFIKNLENRGVLI